jgi:hypothetical protein
MLRYAVVFLVLLTLPVRANLGDTVEQCVKRYGKPVGYTEAVPPSPFGTLGFVASGYTLVIFLSHNVEVGARVSKTDKSALSDAEIKTIMDAETGAPWTTKESPDPTCLTWTRTDKSTALYDKAKHVLIFTSPAMAEAIRAVPAKPSGSAAPGANAVPAATNVAPTAPPGTFAPAPATPWTAPGVPAAPAAPAKPVGN